MSNEGIKKRPMTIEDLVFIVNAPEENKAVDWQMVATLLAEWVEAELAKRKGDSTWGPDHPSYDEMGQ